MSEIAKNVVENGTILKAADQKHCFSCGTLLHNSATQCPKCGAQQPNNSHLSVANSGNVEPANVGLQNHQVYCRGCGAVIHDSAVSCPKCGALQRSSMTILNSGKNRTTAAILAIFLGWIGLHKFYLGSNLAGFFYLLFCWTFIPGLLGLIEGVYYLILTDTEFESKY